MLNLLIIFPLAIQQYLVIALKQEYCMVDRPFKEKEFT